MMKEKRISPFQNTFLFTALIKIFGYAKISFIIGSKFAFFSGVNIITPLSGAFAGRRGIFGVMGSLFLIHLVLFKSFSLHVLAYYVPGFVASLYWSSSSKALRIMPAFICMLLFLVHPTGASSALYSLFWLMPVVCIHFDSIFAKALGTTFTAHAVGSVIWLYTLPTTPDMWLMLIPIVIVERILFATGLVGMHYTLCRLLDYNFSKKLVAMFPSFSSPVKRLN